MSFSKMSEIIEASQTKNLPLWKVILEDDVQERKVTEKESFSRMEKMLDAMLEADKKYDPNLRSQSGLSGGDGARLEAFRKKENRLIGTFLAMVMEKAVKMAESNACMGRIVAAPTAGSCGVIPAVLITYLEEKNVEKNECRDSTHHKRKNDLSFFAHIVELSKYGSHNKTPFGIICK